MCFYCSKHQENLCDDLLFNNGAYAEYIRIPRRIVETNMLAIPKHVSFEEAAMVEPLACVLRGLHETKMEIGDTVAVIGGRPHRPDVCAGGEADRLQRDLSGEARFASGSARHMGAPIVVQVTAVNDPVKAVRKLSHEGRGCDVVIEAVGRPQAWEWSIDMVRKGGTVNFFGGCANGTTVAAGHPAAAL
jgi:L-iditol 2-dehydrogenase